MTAKKKTSPKAKGKNKKTGPLSDNPVAVETETEEKTAETRTVEPETIEPEAVEESLLLPEDIQKLIQDKEGQYDRLLRIQADFDNYRKRVQKEQANLLRYGAENALREILPVIDNIELAVDSARAHGDSNSQLREGVEMILNQFFSVLEKLGVKPIETVSHPFDPNKHDAMLRVHAPDADEGAVVGEIRKGYYLYDKVLRPAQVTVGTREPQQESGRPPEESE